VRQHFLACGQRSTFGDYLKPRIRRLSALADSSGVNVHGPLPTAWVKLAMLLLNLLVWIDAAAQVAR
jgi:hypothetical protein